MDEHVFKLGKLGPPTPWGERAGKAGHFSAMRAFEQASSETWIRFQVLPLVSTEDALSSVANWTTDNAMKNPNSQAELVEERELPNLSIPHADTVRVISQETKTPTVKGFPYIVSAAVGSVALYVFILRGDIPMAIEDIVELVSVQTSKLSSKSFYPGLFES